MHRPMATKRTTKKLNVKVTDDQYAALVAMAAASDMTLANYVRFRLGLPLETRGDRKDLREAPKGH
jgi:predicted HicB family RNase H-like nuclease